MSKLTICEQTKNIQNGFLNFKRFKSKQEDCISFLNENGRISIAPLKNLLDHTDNWKTSIKKHLYKDNDSDHKHNTSSAQAVVVYCALHLYHIESELQSGHGICSNGHIGFIQELTGLKRPAIKRALKLLNDLGYIHNLVIEPFRKSISFMIPNYSDMFNTAKQGGKGYININQDFIRTISTYTKIDLLRLTLRAYAVIDNPNLDKPDQTLHYSQIRSWFRGHITKEDILALIKTINDNNSILRVEKNGELYRLFAVDGKTCRHIKEQTINSNYKQINEEVDKIHQDYTALFNYANEYNESHGTFPSWILTNDTEKENGRVDDNRIFTPNKLLLQTCARLSANLGLDLIIKALRYLCDAVTLRRHEINSYPAYITSLVHNHPDGIFSDVGWEE